MPLLDHFRPPLYPTRPWESFHAAWANALMENLNTQLPPRYFAAIHVHLGNRVEADVAEFETPEPANGPGGVAVAAWAPPTAALTIPAVFPDDIEVQVLDTRDGAVVVGVIELVSPRNKDRPEARRAFTAKCAAYLQRGVGLVVVDVVATRQASLHDELLSLLAPALGIARSPGLAASAYRPVRRDEANHIDIWTEGLEIDHALPTLPLGLRGGPCVPLDLEAAYAEACQRSRL